MNLNQLSSGDLIADRRAEYAHMLADSGDHAGAADLMVPGAGARSRLGGRLVPPRGL